MESENKVKEKIGEIIEALKKYTSIYEIRLFGSQATKYSEKSDIDLAILCHHKNEYLSILKEIAELSVIHSMLIHPVIFEEEIEEICKNKYKKENIIDKSIIVYTNK
jgi:predicted nucleotidyltransferase